MVRFLLTHRSIAEIEALYDNCLNCLAGKWPLLATTLWQEAMHLGYAPQEVANLLELCQSQYQSLPLLVDKVLRPSSYEVFQKGIKNWCHSWGL